MFIGKQPAKNPQDTPPNDSIYQYYHVHDHTGLTTCNDGHCHIHPGVTSIPIGEGASHYHEIVGATTYQDGHYHVYRTYTQSAAALPDGYHTHFISFTTSFVDGHVHNVMGYTSAVKPEDYKPNPDKK